MVGKIWMTLWWSHCQILWPELRRIRRRQWKKLRNLLKRFPKENLEMRQAVKEILEEPGSQFLEGFGPPWRSPIAEASIATSTPVIQLEEIFRRNIQVQAPPPNVWTTMGMGRSLLDPERIARDTTRGGRSLPDTERLNMEEEEVDHCSDIQ